MTHMGWLQLLSALYLSLVFWLAVSLNEQRAPGRVLRQTLRRWLKSLLVAAVLAVAITLLD